MSYPKWTEFELGINVEIKGHLCRQKGKIRINVNSASEVDRLG